MYFPFGMYAMASAKKEISAKEIEEMYALMNRWIKGGVKTPREVVNYVLENVRSSTIRATMYRYCAELYNSNPDIKQRWHVDSFCRRIIMHDTDVDWTTLFAL